MFNRDEIIKMAREAGVFTPDGHCATVTIEVAERFAALVTAAEREACAKVCEAKKNDPNEWFYERSMAGRCATAIRARGAA